MATSVTTSSTKKKKLVYKQDADGVFRLKKVEADPKPKAVVGDENKAVDDFLDELAECSYRVIDPTEVASEPVIEIPEKPPSEPVRDSHSPVRDEYTKPPLTKPKSKHERKPSKPPTPPSEPVTPTKSEPEDTHLIAGFIDLMLRFNVPSFVLGLITAVMVQRMQPLLTKYAMVGLNALKIGIFWGTIIGAAGWYLGVVKPHDIETVKEFGARMKERITGRPVQQEEPVQEEYSDEEEPEMDLGGALSATEEHEHGGIAKGMPEQRYARRPPASSPAKLERRNTRTRVTPFVYNHASAKDSSRARSTSDLYTSRGQAPYLNRIQTTELRDFSRRNQGPPPDNFRSPRNSPDLYRLHSNESRRSASPETHSRASPSRAWPAKKLPSYPLEAEELPFINEVKLMSNEEMDYDGPPSIPENPVKRSSSVLSKKSVLGTRANYNKFLANVPQKHE